MSYYNRHEGDLFPGKIAKSEDIHQIQTNIADAIEHLIRDQYDNTSFILGSRENDFIISPAPKRLGRYIDNMNIFDDASEIWLDIDSYGYKQAIKTSKTSLYSVIVKLRNTYSQDQDVSFELWSNENRIAKQTITIPARTQSAEFEVVFNLEHFSTQHGRSAEELEKPDAPFIAQPGIERIVEQEYSRENNPNNQSIGATQLYLVVKAIHKATEIITPTEDEGLIDENTFMICADSQGGYGQLLERTADDGRNYESTNYDLFFKSIYSNAPTYLCTGGEAVISGVPVVCNDTHVIIDGASTSGNTKSYIAMDRWGQLKSYTSHAYWGDESEAIFDEFPVEDLIIAIIYTYNADIKQPKIVQDDTLIEDLLQKDEFGEHEFGIPIRQRTHHERIRRLEKEMIYQRDITIPSRLKYNLSGEDIVDSDSFADNVGIKISSLIAPYVTSLTVTSSVGNDTSNGNPQLIDITDSQKAVDWSKYFISTDKYGNFVIKSTEAETVQIPVTLTETRTTENKKGIQLAQTIVSAQNVDIHSEAGIAELSEFKKETTKEVEKDSQLASYGVGASSKEAKLTELNPWDDKKGNRPETADIKPTTRVFTTKKGVNGVHVRSSEYPAMTLYLPEKVTLKELAVPVTKFKNVESVQFHIWERQGPNNQHNTVWLEKLVYSSKKFSLKNAQTKSGYQILDEPFVISFKNGLPLRKHQYIILVQIFPKSGDGSVYVETYTPKKSTDFLIRYHGSADCAHFRLKTRYREVWYTSAGQNTKTKAVVKAYVNEFYKEGRIESGEVIWENSEPIASITPSMNATIPDGCSIELQANTGNGWKTLENDKTTKITGGTSSFKWRAILKGNAKQSPEIKYNESKKYAINFSITKQKPQAGAGLNNNIHEKNVITTKTFYPGDILQKYIGDSNLNTCDKFSNYEWLRIYAENEGDTKAVIDIAASDKRLTTEPPSAGETDYKVVTTDSNSCSPKQNQYDIFTLYYADLTLDDFTRDSVDYSNYDNNIEYDEHNLRFKIDTDKAYNDDNIALLKIQDATVLVNERDESLVEITTDEETGNEIETDNNPVITIDPHENYLTVFFKDFTSSSDNMYSTDNTFIWKYTLPGNSTLDLSNYSALKIRYKYKSENINGDDASLSGIGLYISSAIEEEPPSDNNDIELQYNDKNILEYENMAPETLEATELEKYKNSILKVTRVKNGITYIEYYYYVPDENGVWRRRQYHNIKSFSIFKFSDLETSFTKDNDYLTIPIDTYNDNFKYVKEIGLITLNNEEKPTDSLNVTGKSSFQVLDIKGVIQGYNEIYSANKNITLNPDFNGHYKTTLFRDTSNQLSSLTRVFYNRLSATGEQIGYINNDSITTDANNFAIQFVSDVYLPKDSLYINLCAEKNGVNPVFTLNMPTLNHVYYDPDLYSPEIFNRTEEQNQIKRIDNDAVISESESSFSIKTAEKKYTLPNNGKESDYPSNKRVTYNVSIEPEQTTLTVEKDTFKWNVYRQEVTIENGKEVYGTKEFMTEVYTDVANGNGQSETKITPKFQVQIAGKTFSSVSGNTNVMSIPNDNFGFKFDYKPGQYQFKIGFQGYSVLVDNPSDTKHHGKIVTYRSASNAFNVNIYWVISNKISFAQIYKKINEDREIKSISINTTAKFQEYMNTIKGTTASSDTDYDKYIHLLIKNMVLHEAEHIPMFHPNVRMKIYSKKTDGSDTDVEAIGIRKIGAVIEYK